MKDNYKMLIFLLVAVIGLPTLVFSMVTPTTIRMIKQPEAKQISLYQHNIGINDTALIYFQGQLMELIRYSNGGLIHSVCHYRIRLKSRRIDHKR